MLRHESQLNHLYRSLDESQDQYRPIVIDGYSTNYMIDRSGNIFSTFIKYQDPVFVKHNYYRSDIDKIPYCQLFAGRKEEHHNVACQVATLVAETFIPNPHHYQYLIHLDYHLSNVKAGNLKWVSRKEWEKHEMERQEHFRSQKGDRLIPGSNYYATPAGSIYSIYRPQKGVRKIKERHWNGVMLRKDGKRKLFHSDYLVAQAFHANPHHYRFVKHLNHDSHDDRANNLAWCDWNEMILSNYFYSNQDVQADDFRIVNVGGFHTLYAINNKGIIYSLLKKKKVSGKNHKNGETTLFNLRINGRDYTWSQQRIMQYAIDTPSSAIS